MPIPKEILAVERPVNTVVVAYGKDRSRFAVRQRVGCRYVGGRRLPVNGPTIGHIVDGRYVPRARPAPEAPAPVSQAPVDLRDWAVVELVSRVSGDLLGELRSVYAEEDAVRILCIAALRVCYPGVRDSELRERYEDSVLCDLHPGVALSRNSVSRFLNGLGRACSRISRFMRARAEAVGADHHLLVDGTLKTDDSRVNSLSDFSRKASRKGTRDISILYAYDLERREPVCSKCFPGNMLDLTAYEEFLEENGVTRGLVVADRGFPSGAAAGHLSRHPELHHLNPVRRSSRLIAAHDLRRLTSILPGFEGVTCRKERCGEEDRWLYAFRDAARAAEEERSWLDRAGARCSHSSEEHERRRQSFGLVVLESDLDMPPETAYRAYACRWEIEIVMRYYKSACEFDETRVHDDYSVIGSEFCDFLATVLTFRLLRAFDEAGLLEKRGYGRIMSILRRAKKVRLDGDEWRLIKINPSYIELLQALGLLPKPDTPPKRRRGRPPKSTV